MNGLPYYKRYPRDFIEGTIGMPFELKATYSIILDMIYMQGGNLPDDPRYISGVLGVSVRKWKSLREGLLKVGKLSVSGEFLTNNRAVSELEMLTSYQEKQRENASKPRKNNGLTKASAKPKASHTEPEPESEYIEDTNVSLSVPTDAPAPAGDISEAVSIYNQAAKRCGWPQVQKNTPNRSKQLKARLKDCAGIEGWKIAIEKAEASDFICGRTSKQWNGFGFDWVIKAQNFTKLMEGNYDNRTNEGGAVRRNGSGRGGPGSGTADAFAAVAARMSQGQGGGI